MSGLRVSDLGLRVESSFLPQRLPKTPAKSWNCAHGHALERVPPDVCVSDKLEPGLIMNSSSKDDKKTNPKP